MTLFLLREAASGKVLAYYDTYDEAFSELVQQEVDDMLNDRFVNNSYKITEEVFDDDRH